MAGLLEMLERLDPEQLRRLAQESGASVQQKPEQPMIQVPMYGIDGLRYESMPSQPVPVYDMEGFRYMYPDWMKSKGY